jgi:hypothetical protein
MRRDVGLSRSHTQATTAPHSGVVAFKIELSPVLICSTEKPNSANGIPLLSAPTNKMGLKCWRSAASWPRHTSSGSRKSDANSTRKNAIANGPNSAAPSFISKNEPPHMAASKTNSKTMELRMS